MVLRRAARGALSADVVSVTGRAKSVLAIVVVLSALAARVAVLTTASASADLANYSFVAARLRGHEPLYESGRGRYNYSPVWSWILGGLDSLSHSCGVSLTWLIRALLTAVDVAVALVLARLARRTARAPEVAAALYLANPISIWVSGFQGAFDNLALLTLLFAISSQDVRRAGPWLWASMAVKQVTVLHPILWTRRKRDFGYVVLAYAAFAALFLPYARQWRAIVDDVLLYRSVPRSYGFSEWILWNDRLALLLSLVAVGAAGLSAWLLRFHDRVRSSLFVFLVLLFFAPGLGSQYLLWPLPFAALLPSFRALLFSAAGLAWILGSHFGLPGSGRWLGHLVWLSVAFWAVGELRILRAERSLKWTM